MEGMVGYISVAYLCPITAKQVPVKDAGNQKRSERVAMQVSPVTLWIEGSSAGVDIQCMAVQSNLDSGTLPGRGHVIELHPRRYYTPSLG